MNHRSALPQHKSGQAMLLLVLIALVVSLGLALSVANRSNLQQRGSTYNVQSEQAYSAAESGLDAMLEYFSTTGSVNCNSPTELTGDVGLGSYTVSYTCVKGVGNSELELPPITLRKNVPEIFYLNDSIATVRVEWNNQNNSEPAMEMNFIDINNNASDTFKQYSYRWYGSNYSNLDNPGWNSSDNRSYVFYPPYSGVTNGMDYMQLTARHADAHDVVVKLQPSNGNIAPLQGYQITSVGTSGKSKRTIVAFYRPANIGNVINNIFYTVQSPTSD